MSASRYVFKNRTFLPSRYQGGTDARGTVELFIDWDKIVSELGRKAARNKNYRSALAIGIKAKFTPAKEAA